MRISPRVEAPGGHEIVIGTRQGIGIVQDGFERGEMNGTPADDITYRMFRLNPNGEAQGAPVTIKAVSDDAAVRHAQKIASDVSVMLCKGTRVVAGWTVGAVQPGLGPELCRGV